MREYDLTNLLKTIAGVRGLQLPPEHIGYYGSHTFCLAKKIKNAQYDLNAEGYYFKYSMSSSNSIVPSANANCIQPKSQQ